MKQIIILIVAVLLQACAVNAYYADGSRTCRLDQPGGVHCSGGLVQTPVQYPYSPEQVNRFPKSETPADARFPGVATGYRNVPYHNPSAYQRTERMETEQQPAPPKKVVPVEHKPGGYKLN